MPRGLSIYNSSALSEEERQAGAELADDPFVERPKHRSECVDGLRPCPWVGCRYHLAVNVSHAGGLALPFGEDPDDWPESCALDVAERGGLTLEGVGELSGLTRERIRQVEARALVTFKRRLKKAGITDFDSPVRQSLLAQAQDEHAQSGRLIYRPTMPADIPPEPRQPFASPNCTPKRRRKEMAQTSKLDLLTGQGKRLVTKAINSNGNISGFDLHEQLVEAGFEEQIPSAKACHGFLQRRWDKGKGTPEASSTPAGPSKALATVEPQATAEDIVEAINADPEPYVGGTIELQPSPHVAVPRGCAALLVNVEDLRRLLG